MSDVFYPTLAISMGPSAKKALDFLDDMLVEIPDSFANLIEFYNVENTFESYKYIQNIVDEKLLSASKLNKLVDLGYKIRTESTANVKVNIYIYWDVYNYNLPVLEFIKGLFNINYGGVDKSKHSGVAVFIIPMLDKEWLYNSDHIRGCIDTLESVIEYISIEDNIVNKDSKVLLAHSISKDGTRISLEELEYACAIISYLNILPSPKPPLSSFNRRMLKHESNYKIGTIGISILTVFKERLLNDFSKNLMRDLLDRASKYEEEIEYSIYSGSIYSDNKYFIRELQEYKLKEYDESKISISELSIINKNVAQYPDRLNEWKVKVKEEGTEELKIKISKKAEETLINTKKTIDMDLKNIIQNYSLLQGRKYLEFLLNNILKGNILQENHEDNQDEELMKDIEEKIEGYPNFISFSLKTALLMVFLIYSFINIISTFSFVNGYERIVYLSIFILSLVVGLGVIILEYLYYDKKIERLIQGYIEEINKKENKVIKNYWVEQTISYKNALLDHIDSKLVNIDDCIDNCLKMERKIFEKPEAEYSFGNLVSNLLDENDRERFYKENKNDIALTYSEFINEIGNFEILKEQWSFDIINEFVKGISYDYANIDFYDFIKFKWCNESDKKIEDWLKKGTVKAKELLQYNEGSNLEVNKIFLGSNEFINCFKGTLSNELDKYNLIPIQGGDISTNCIAVLKLTLGIDIKSINPFVNVMKGDKE